MVVVLEVSSKGAGVMVPQRSLGVITTQGRYIEVYRTVGNVAYRIVSNQPSVQKITALNVAYRTWREKVEKIRNVAA